MTTMLACEYNLVLDSKQTFSPLLEIHVIILSINWSLGSMHSSPIAHDIRGYMGQHHLCRFPIYYSSVQGCLRLDELSLCYSLPEDSRRMLYLLLYHIIFVSNYFKTCDQWIPLLGLLWFILSRETWLATPFLLSFQSSSLFCTFIAPFQTTHWQGLT